MPKEDRAFIINELPIGDRSDLDSFFLCDDPELAHLYSKQQELPIESYAEAKRNGTFTPKPRAWDVHKSLRTFRRLILKGNDVGALKFDDVVELIESLGEFLQSFGEEQQGIELKKYLYVVMRDKRYAETLEGNPSLLLEKALKETLDNLPLSHNFFWTAELTEVRKAWAEIMSELDPLDEDGMVVNDPLRRAEIKRRFPTLYKIEYGQT